MLTNDTLTNDTLIGDPLYAVPFTEDGVSLCFEVHGAASQYFNLVSDTCTNVNVFYAPSPLLNDSRNVVEQIGVRAVGSSGTCYNIRVYESDTEGICVASVDNTTVGSGGIEVDGIRVRRIMDRVRISVPNCENINLVMWVTCEERNGLRMLRFDISRGLTLRPTSHGLIGTSCRDHVVLNVQLCEGFGYHVLFIIHPCINNLSTYMDGILYLIISSSCLHFCM